MDKAQIKTKLLAEIDKTKLSIEEYKDMSKPTEPDCAIGQVSRMDAINNNSVTLAALRKAEEKLVGLTRVLDQLDTKDFGICLKCKQPIPIERIIFRPQSLLCVKCAR
ncbi:MAG: TraR/DksA family transcriptional regulator [Putridiphycobacter sp.]